MPVAACVESGNLGIVSKACKKESVRERERDIRSVGKAAHALLLVGKPRAISTMNEEVGP